jgi:uncharacterized protein HemY
MMIANQVVHSVMYNIAIAIFIIILCLVFVGLVVVLEWLLTYVLDSLDKLMDSFDDFRSRKSRKQERYNGQL